MSQDGVERFLGRLITDSAFRTRVGICIRTACYAAGISLSQAELTLLSHVNLSQIGNLAQTLDDRIRRS